MLGFVIGIGCLIALFVVLKRGRRHGFYRYGGHFGGRYWLNEMFDRLGTSNAQEKVILAAASDVQEQLRGMRTQLREARGQVAAALRQERLDTEQLSQAIGQQEAELQQIRQRVVAMLATVHETLDEKQRQQVARWIENGFYGVGPGWHHHGCGSYAA